MILRDNADTVVTPGLPTVLRGLPRSREECVRGLSKPNSSSVILGAGEAGATGVAPLFELGATDVLLVARP